MVDIIVIGGENEGRDNLCARAMALDVGLTVRCFSDSRSALISCGTTPPDLVMINLDVTERHAPDLVRTLKVQSWATDVPILLVTDIKQRKSCEEGLAAGAADFVLTPLDNDEFQLRARRLFPTTGPSGQPKAPRPDAAVGGPTKRDALPIAAGHGQHVTRLVDAMPTLISAVGKEGRLTHVNEAHRRIFGVVPAEVIGLGQEALYGEEEAAHQRGLDTQVFKSGESLNGFEREVVHPKSKKRHRLLMAKSPLFDDAGGVSEVVTFAQEITARTSAHVRMRRHTDRDPLTSLPKRAVYRHYLDHALIAALRRETRSALVLIDLDRFKGINDAFGLAFGDVLLKRVAERLSHHLRDGDVIGYLGGDEFAILLTEVAGRDETRTLAAELVSVLDTPFVIENESIYVTASIGITMFPEDGQKADRLLKNAELAMRRAKEIGRNAHCFFTPRMNMVARRTGLLEKELRVAAAENQFTIHYQPTRSLSNHRIVGMEALLRWQHPRRGMIRPTEFIALAETMGLINPVTEHVLQQACLEHRSWIEKGFPPLRLAVNLSPIQFREEGVVDLVKSMLDRTGIPPETLEIELTEGVMLENSRIALDSLTRLHDLGITFSLDDFGTGYSSLSYIHRLPIQRLKIDRSFVQRLGRDGQEDAIVRAIIDLGHSLNLDITAEGVETVEQLQRLTALGCDEVQGDLISPPLPAEAFESLLYQESPKAAAAAVVG